MVFPSHRLVGLTTIQQASNGDISTDQLRSVYSLILRSASPPQTRYCLDLLRSTKAQTGKIDLAQTIRIIGVASIPSIPLLELPLYLDDLAHIVLETEAGSVGRLELAALAFKVVMEEMGDESKLVGIDWWLRWRDVFEGRPGVRVQVGAKM
jgi:hypothetical protein